MDRHRDRRSLERVPRARGTRAAATGPRTDRAERRRAGAMVDEGALALLSDVLIGDSHWTMPEIRRLIALRERSHGGRWSVGSPDDGAGAR